MKIALVHHCNYGIESMTDKSWWFNVDNIDCSEGDFVVTVNKYQNGNKMNLCIGWIQTIKENEDENPTSYIVSKIIHDNEEFLTPMTETEFSNFYNNLNEDDIPF